MSSGAKNKRDGARFETELVAHLREAGHDAERMRLTGKEDEGDIAVRIDGNMRLVIEAKAGKNLRPRYWYEEEAVPECRNYSARRGLEQGSAVPMLAMKSHGKNISKALVTMTLEDLLALID